MRGAGSARPRRDGLPTGFLSADRIRQSSRQRSRALTPGHPASAEVRHADTACQLAMALAQRLPLKPARDCIGSYPQWRFFGVLEPVRAFVRLLLCGNISI